MFSRSSVLILLFLCASPAIAGPRESVARVSVRIYDYAHIAPRQLRQATRQVGRTYASAGVRLDWRATVRPRELDSGRGRWPKDGAADFAVVVLTTEMSHRFAVRTEVAGYAPVNPAVGGRVAYVFGDRIVRIAASVRVDEAKVLAGVIVHEMAHLLMPERQHASTGLMRAVWRPDEFRTIDQERFSTDEAGAIKRAALARGGAPRAAD
jgi:hypothetical protein